MSQSKASVYVTRRIPEAGLQLLRDAIGDFDMNPEDRVLKPEELLHAVRGRDAVLCLLTDKIDDSVFESAGTNCKVFANYAVGYNNIDLDAAKRRGIQITNTPGVLTHATADLAWTLLFATARRLVEASDHIRSGQWNGWGPMQFVGQDITGATLGVVGAGRIGREFALKSSGFGMKVLYTSPRANPDLEQKLGATKVELDELLKQSDFVALHVPLKPETTHLIGARELGLMKPTAVLINTARGPVVDEAALFEALKSRKIFGAGLDVFENEPAVYPGLLELPNVVALPHIASATHATRDKMATMAVENLLAALDGHTPPNALVKFD